MFKRTFSGVLVLLFTGMVLATSVLAEDVYVTKYGKKYHKKDSRFIKGKDVTKLDREEAEAQGYMPGAEFSKENSESAQQGSKK